MSLIERKLFGWKLRLLVVVVVVFCLYILFSPSKNPTDGQIHLAVLGATAAEMFNSIDKDTKDTLDAAIIAANVERIGREHSDRRVVDVLKIEKNRLRLMTLVYATPASQRYGGCRDPSCAMRTELTFWRQPENPKKIFCRAEPPLPGTILCRDKEQK